MSAFGGKADIIQGVLECPLIAISGHHILSLSDGKKLENMIIGIAKIYPAAPAAVVYAHVLQCPGSAPVGNPRLPDTSKDLIEILFAHFEKLSGVMSRRGRRPRHSTVDE